MVSRVSLARVGKVERAEIIRFRAPTCAYQSELVRNWVRAVRGLPYAEYGTYGPESRSLTDRRRGALCGIIGYRMEARESPTRPAVNLDTCGGTVIQDGNSCARNHLARVDAAPACGPRMVVARLVVRLSGWRGGG